MLNKRCYITGAEGFIGYKLYQTLIHNGAKVRYCSISKKPLFPNHDKWNITDEYPYKIEDYDFVFHLAALTDLKRCNEDKELAHKINREGTKNVALFAQKANAKLVYISTLGVYGNYQYLPIDENHPANPLEEYTKSKLEGEKVIEYQAGIKDFNYVIARLFSVYGSGENENRIMTKIINQAIAGNEITLYSSPAVTRDYIYIDDIISGIIKIAEYGTSNIYNIGTGQENSLSEIVKLIGKILNKKLIIKVIENKNYQTLDRSCADITKIVNETKWRPKYILENGLNEMIKNLKN